MFSFIGCFLLSVFWSSIAPSSKNIMQAICIIIKFLVAMTKLKETGEINYNNILFDPVFLKYYFNR